MKLAETHILPVSFKITARELDRASSEFFSPFTRLDNDYMIIWR